METAWLIYLYLVVGKVVAALVCLAIVATVLFFAAMLACSIAEDDGYNRNNEWEHTKKVWAARKHLITICLIAFVANIIYPDRGSLAIIFGGSALVSVAQTDEAKKLPDNILKAANSFLEGVHEEAE